MDEGEKEVKVGKDWNKKNKKIKKETTKWPRSLVLAAEY